MQTILLGLTVGIFITVARFSEVSRYQKELKSVKENHGPFEVKNKSQNYLLFLGFFLIPAMILLYLGFTQHNDFDIAFGIFFLFLFISEAYYALFALKIFHNQDGVVIKHKFIKYKNMKSIKRIYPLPISKCDLLLQNNIHVEVSSMIANFLIKEKGIKLVTNH